METTFAATRLGSMLPPDVRHLIFEYVCKHQMSLVFEELKMTCIKTPAVQNWVKVHYVCVLSPLEFYEVERR